MNASPSTWEDYFYPLPPGSGTVPDFTRVLKNRPGIDNVFDLMDFERDHTLIRTLQIAAGEISIARTFDADHLTAIHAAVFQDVYTWAGEFRTVGMQKPRPPAVWQDPAVPEYELFAPLSTIKDGLAFIADEIRQIPWEILDQHGVATALAQTHTQLTYVHPFREGNGRTTRIFIEHLAEHAGYELGPYPDKDTYIAAVVEANQGRYAALTEILEQRLTPATRIHHVAPSAPERAVALTHTPTPTVHQQAPRTTPTPPQLAP